MKKYMLILFSYIGLKKINEEIKEKLEPNDQLVVRAMKLEKVPKLSKHLVSDLGFLGEKVVNDVEDSVLDIHRGNAKDYLKEIKEIAAEENFELNKKLIEKYKLKDLKKEIKNSDFDQLFINLSKNEFASNPEKEAELKKWLQKIKLSQNIFYDGQR